MWWREEGTRVEERWEEGQGDQESRIFWEPTCGWGVRSRDWEPPVCVLREGPRVPVHWLWPE